MNVFLGEVVQIYIYILWKKNLLVSNFPPLLIQIDFSAALFQAQKEEPPQGLTKKKN